MGTSGPGVFENDHARDVFADATGYMIGELQEIMSDRSASIEDTEGPLALVEMLAVLAERCIRVPLERAKLEQWKARFLKIYDAEVDDLDPDPAYKKQRRKVIEETFDRLAPYLRDGNKPAEKLGAAAAKTAARPVPETGSLNVARALPEKKMKAGAAAAKKAGAKRGPKKRVVNEK